VDNAEALRPEAKTSELLDADFVWELLDAAPDGILVADETGVILLVNRRILELFGYERAELIGRPIEVLMPDRFRQVHRAHRTRYRAEPRTRPMASGLDLFGVHRDGRELPVEISLSPLRSPAGLLVVACIRDIADRVALEAEQRQIRELLDATRDAILIFDADTLRFTYVNQGAIEQVGYSRDELLQMTMLHLAPEFTEASLADLLAPFRRGETASTMFTTVHRRSDGVDIPVEIVLQAGALAGGSPTAFISVVRDISERVEIEERLRQAGEEVRLLEDRDRIARDLHDKVIQRLFAEGMSMQALIGRVSTQDTDTASRMEVVVDELDETIREIRSAIYGLRPQGAPTGLRQQILRIVEEQSSALGVEPHLMMNGIVDAVPDEIADHLLAVLREALSNVARHATATAVDITVNVDDDVTLRVVDNGVGISEAPTTGHGVRNMAKRAAELRGTFRAVRAAEGGSVVEWRVPNRAD